MKPLYFWGNLGGSSLHCLPEGKGKYWKAKKDTIAKLQIKPKSKSNQTKNLERLYIWVVVCLLFVVCSLAQRWSQRWF